VHCLRKPLFPDDHGPWIAQAVGAVARLGVADQLANGPKSSAQLAEAVGANADSLARTLRALASVGLFSSPAPDTWALTPVGDCLRTDAPGSMRYLAIAETDHAHWTTWGRFADAVRKVANIADVGGAYGALLAAILRTQPQARGILFDQPQVVEGASAMLGEVSSRVERVAGDFLSQTVPSADVYLLKHILHDWDDDSSVKILKNVRATWRQVPACS